MTVAHFPLERLAKAIRADGVNCVIRPGAQGRSARRFSTAYGASRDGYYVGCQAIVEHHTVSSGINPENDLWYIERGKGDGYVIANAYTDIYGTVHLVASGPTYTEGSGGPFGIIPENRGNDVAFSNEIASWGAVDSVYPSPPQQEAVAAFAYHAAVIAADVWDWPDDPFAEHRSFAHFEWAPGRKVDPRGISRWSPKGGMWDMDALRAELRSRHNATPQPPEIIDPPTETDMGTFNGLRLRITDKSGRQYHDQVLGLTIANPGQRDQLGADAAPLIEAKLDATRAEIEAQLGFTLSPKDS